MKKFFDSLRNLVTNLGVPGKDKHAASYFSAVPEVDQSELNAIYQQGGIGGKVVDVVADDLGRAWRDISVPDKDPQLFKDIETALHVVQAVADLVRWSRLQGGAVILVDVEGDEPEDELLLDTLSPNKPVTGLRVAHRHEFAGGDIDLVTGRKTSYKLLKENTTYHPSRVIGPLDGLPLPVDELRDNDGWGVSVLSRCYSSLLAEATAAAATAAIIHEAKTDVISVKGMSAMLDGGTQQTAFEERYMLAARLKGITNLLLLDADVETYEAKEAAGSMQGTSSLLERFANRISAEVDIPMTRLYGKLASGLSTSGDTNQQDYYDMLTAFRATRVTPLLDILDGMLLRSVYGTVPEGFTYTWKPFRENTDKEQAEIDKLHAETAEVYLRIGAVVPAHIVRRVAESGPYTLKPEYVEYMERRDGVDESSSEPDREAAAAAAAAAAGEQGEEGADPLVASKVEPQKTALNGAQVSSLMSIAAKVKLGELDYEQGMGIILLGFPTVTEPEARRIVKTEVEEPEPEPVPEVTPPGTEDPVPPPE